MNGACTESTVEQAAFTSFASLGYAVKAGPDIAPDGFTPERGSYTDVILHGCLRQALAQLNSTLSPEALDDAFRRLTRPQGRTLAVLRDKPLPRLISGKFVEKDAQKFAGRARG